MNQQRSLGRATLGALGVVYGDIGTSPLYALKGATAIAGGGAADSGTVLGVLSLIFWSMFIVITLKYIVLILRSDNAGEGGILSLLALVQQKLGTSSAWALRFGALAALGTALFYCDGMITPAISVLSAVEGLEVLNPELESMVLPVTLAIIVVLFVLQKRGTARVGGLFGPIMVLWFVTIGLLGILMIARRPEVLAALNPGYALAMLAQHPAVALAILGAVFLTLTGGEALYADMGHFGKQPVRLAWFALVWPGLLLNYFGQGALMLEAPGLENPFFSLAAASALPFLVLLATAATIIASQATISGAFSLTRQAVQLDLLPRVQILQTSPDERGQVYVPAVNRILFLAVVAFVLVFGSSDALMSAYGAAVIGTMMITTLLGAVVAKTSWQWPTWRIVAVFGLFIFVDLSFVAGNATKIMSGGWVPLALAAIMFAGFITWRDGRAKLRHELRARAVPLTALPSLLENCARVPGTAVFLVSHSGFVPTALLRNLEHNHVCHEQIVIMNFEIVRSPRQDRVARAWVEELMPNVHAVHARFGFMETPDVAEAIRGARQRGLRIDEADCTYFVGWHLVRAKPRSGLSGLKAEVFAYLQRRSTQAAEFFRMPTKRVVMLATEIDI
ncbi:MAG TPA: KUP/HAK/KT family potassium transporter [Rhodanobacteraceae bacterium]|nr:KUP/HAK/KT family potassium transporter [Rhodanobacteraceae bacterium]